MANKSDRLPFVASQLAESYRDVGSLPVRVILHDVRSLYNVGAFFRTADAVGIDQVCICGITGYPPHPKLHKTALGAENHVSWERASDAESYVEQLRRRD